MEISSQDERRAGGKSKTRNDLIRYVEELAGPHDEWITVVDSARITGSSESMANRWVTSGRLPIRGYAETQLGELAGVPPRTRQCRLSDVARIRPILYPEQAISPIVRTLNLPSIPKEVARLTLEHQQIAADHLQLMQQFTELQEAIDTSREQFQREMHQQGENHLSQVRALREELSQQVNQAVQRLTEAQQSLSDGLGQAQESLQTLDRQLREGIQTLQGEHGELARLVESYRRQAQQALEELVADHTRTLLEYQQTVEEVLRQAERAAQERFTTLEKRLTTETTGLAGQIMALDERLSTAATNFGAYTVTIGEQLSSMGQRYEAMNQTMSEQGAKLARYEGLEQTVSELQAKLSRYEQLEPLLAYVADLQRLATEPRSSLPSDPAT